MQEINQNSIEEFSEAKPQEIIKAEIPTPDNPPWNGWAALGVWAASIIFIVFFSNVLLFIYVSRQGLNLTDSEKIIEFAKTDATAILLQFVAIIPAHLLTLALAWLVVTRLNKFSFRQTLGWEMNGFKIWHAFVLFAGFYAVAILLTLSFGDVENDFEKMIRNSPAAVYFVAFFATFTAPLIEEVVYRGLLYSAFRRRFGVILAVTFITLLFTAVHVPQYSVENVPDYASVITLLILSLTLTLIRVRTGNLLPCIILHTVINGVQSVFLILSPLLPTDAIPAPDTTPAIFIHLIK